MDPLTALSVAGNVVQFIDFGRKILSASQKLYQDGQLQVHEEAARAAADISNFSTQLSDQLQNISDLTSNERALGEVCHGCIDVAKTLTTGVEKLKVDSHKKALKSFGAAIRTVWKQEELKEINQRLSAFRKAINTRLLGAIRDRMEVLAREQAIRSNSLEQRVQQQIGAAMLDVNESLTRDIRAQTLALTRILERRSELPGPPQNSIPNSSQDNDLKESIFQRTSEAERELLHTIQDEERKTRDEVAEEIIQSLKFPSISERFEEVPEAHQSTFEWIFQEEGTGNTHKPWSNFIQWLRSGTGIYWINGKAGSGKSTLMKFIFNNLETRRNLNVWAGDSTLYIAGFFFWNSGTKQQKSQSGLFRSILYDVLRQMPALVEFVLPRDWETTYARRTGKSMELPDRVWLPSLLKESFYTLVNQERTPMKLCLFIDGLDEYEGSDREVAKFFQDAVFSSQVKVCLSSRPHVVFQDYFAQRPQLRLQDMTFHDIQIFVTDTLINDEMMQELFLQEPEQCKELVDEIVHSANGVFLWVMLVVRSLLNGLDNHDQIKHLQERLRLLPKDLETLYEHMVLRIDDVYQEEAARIFQLAKTASDKVDDWKDVKPLSLLGMSFAVDGNSNLAIEAREDFLSKEQAFERAKHMDRVLKTRCGGLLETQSTSFHLAVDPWMKVSYIHRTAKDFLNTHHVQKVLSERTGGDSHDAFNPNVAILRSAVLQIKSARIALLEKSDLDGNPPLQPIVDTVLTFARRVEQQTKSTEEAVLDELWKIAAWRDFWTGEAENILAIAAMCGLTLYLERKLVNGIPRSQKRCHRPIIDYVLNPTSETEKFVSWKTVELLLNAGADPMEKFETPYIINFGKSTPWQNALSYIYFDFYSGDEVTLRSLLSEWSLILQLLIDHGADKKAQVDMPYHFTRTGRLNKKISPEIQPNVYEVVEKLANLTPDSYVLLPLLKSTRSVQQTQKSQNWIPVRVKLKKGSRCKQQ